LFPGIVLYLTYWFPPRRRASVMSIFFAGVMVAGVLGGLLSGWIMRDMAGVLGLKGWQWMFVIEGAPAIVLAVVGHFWLQDYPRDVAWLTMVEKARLATDLGEDSHDGAQAAHVSAAGLRNPRVYVFAIVYFAMTCATLTLNFWMPLMIRDFGVSDVVQVSLYSVIPNAIGAVGLLFIARRADRRASHPRYFAVCATGGALALAALTTHPGSLAAALALLSIATILLFAALPIFWAIPTTYLSAEARAGGIAVISSVGITSGIVSPWAIGRIKTATGSMDNALTILSALIMLSVFVLLAAVRRRAQGEAQ
jgi:MFS family permease